MCIFINIQEKALFKVLSTLDIISVSSSIKYFAGDNIIYFI